MTTGRDQATIPASCHKIPTIAGLAIVFLNHEPDTDVLDQRAPAIHISCQ